MFSCASQENGEACYIFESVRVTYKNLIINNNHSIKLYSLYLAYAYDVYTLLHNYQETQCCLHLEGHCYTL